MKRLFIFLVFITVVVFLHTLGLLSPVEKAILKISAPLQIAFRGILNWGGELNQSYFSRKELEEENKRLRERLKELIVDNIEFNQLRDENTSLKKMLSFFEKNSYNQIAARVIGKTAEGDISTIIINKGGQDGVDVNFPVIAENGILIGKVMKVADNSSTILLISDGSSKISGMIQNKTKTVGVLKGGYGLGIRMEFIPQNEKINENEIVITAGLETEIPKGLAIGSVESAIIEQNSPFQTIIIKPLLDYEKIDFVSVLTVL